ncbi:competence protein ComK [Bacillus sp. FJAT-49736]|uniref:competence protein ComK n=1 Tax=Bacillus sp. FJAT-49736 TaxID=2833582 RepID=UPI001BC9E205|nr:competence protein ComK [Bacillus sp. FJAT-49736]MBS4172858.1 competence protein ComK [Bacillus sp. FJAT-49736]
MLEMTKYVINKKTCIIFPHYDEFGNLIAIVIESDLHIIVKMSPLNIIKYSLLKYGSGYQGAKDGAKHILGNTTMNPIMLSEKFELYAIPTKSPTNKECVWFMLGQYKFHKRDGNNQLKVIFKNGFPVKLDVSQKSFENKLQKGYRLKDQIEEIGQQPFNYSASHGCSVVVESLENGYAIRKVNHDEEITDENFGDVF